MTDLPEGSPDMTRYWVESECEHGSMLKHCEHGDTTDHLDGGVKFGACVASCLGGTRRELTIDYEAADKAYREAWLNWWKAGGLALPDPEYFAVDVVRAAVDAALSGGTDEHV